MFIAWLVIYVSGTVFKHLFCYWSDSYRV